MKIDRPLLLLAVVVLLATPALAQGSGATDPSLSTGNRDAFSAPISLTGIVTQIDQEQYVLAITDEKSGQQWVFKTEKRTRFRADKGIFEKKKINWSQLEVGQRVRVTFRTQAQSGEVYVGQGVTEIKVRKSKMTS